MSCVNSWLRWKIPRYCESEWAVQAWEQEPRMKYLLVATLALMLAACGSKGEDDAGQASSATDSRPAAGGDDSVAAALESQGTAVAQLRFVIDSRPVVGKPFGLQLIASTSAPLPQLHVVIESESLAIAAGAARLDLMLEEAGSGSSRSYRASHELTLTPQAIGLAALSVRLSTGPDAPETLYVIPVLVAKAEAGAAQPAPASDKADPATETDNGNPDNG